MPVAPEIACLLPAINAQPPMHKVPVEQLRQVRPRIGATGMQEVGAVEDREIPGHGVKIPVRIYTPHDPAARLPLVLLFHGGGFVFGGIEGYYDHVARVLCAQARCRVVSVGYRLAPEDKFPAATDDAYAALLWATTHAQELGVDIDKVFVAGGSAGANLAASTALRTRDSGGPALRGQILFYPFVDHHIPASNSARDFATGHYLTLDDIAWFWKQYLRDLGDIGNPYAVPLQARSLADLPPAMVVTAEFDPLRDGGEQYAKRMQADGGDVTLTRYDGMIHGFMAFPTEQADKALDQAVEWIRGEVGRVQN